LTTEGIARTLALIFVALVVGLSIRHNTFAAWATDSGAYISAGQAWATGELFSPATFSFWAPWAGDGQVEFPLGHVQGPHKGTITGQYPLGYPLLIAAALKLSGGSPLAPHLVSPVLAGVLAWCAFLLGRRMVSGWAGAGAAFLIAATPVVIGHAVMPFSDVPAAAFWALAWITSLNRGTGAVMAAGAATAMAVMIRPNLAPLAVVIAATATFAEREGWRRAIVRCTVFGVFAALGPLLVLWSQAELYGHPLQNGYRVPMSHFFSLDRVAYNAGLYPRMMGDLHTWLVFAGFAYVPFAVRGMRRGDHAVYSRALIAASAIGLIVINYALYLPYLTYVGWYWLRFLLPAMLALFLLFAAGLDHLRVWLGARWPRLAYAVLLPVVVVMWAAEEHIRPPVGYERIQMMERYLPQVLPANAVILTYAHGGALAAATGRPILRVDYIEGDALDRVIADLQRRGWAPVYVFDVAVEADFVGTRFKNSEWGRLTWPARAELASVTSIVYYDLRDRARFFSGERWPVDVLVDGRSTHGNVAWNDMRAEHERIVLPVFEEGAAFRAMLDVVYRDHLGRAAMPPSIDPGEFLRQMQRYVRFRLHGCSHDTAIDKVREQLMEGRVPGLCGRPDAVHFPPENETMAFREQLADWLGERPIRRQATYVDALGEVVWTQRYFDARVRGCTHAAATAAVIGEIRGGGQSRDCGR
jgi:hypothetical protein